VWLGESDRWQPFRLPSGLPASAMNPEMQIARRGCGAPGTAGADALDNTLGATENARTPACTGTVPSIGSIGGAQNSSLWRSGYFWLIRGEVCSLGLRRPVGRAMRAACGTRRPVAPDRVQRPLEATVLARTVAHR